MVECWLSFYFIVFWGTILPSSAIPISPITLASLQRSPNQPDVLKPVICPTACKELFHAEDIDSDDFHCACICPVDRPIFLTTYSVCVEKFAECPTSLRFSSNLPGEAHLPIINLPAKGAIVNALNPILWKESGIRQRPGAAVNCTLAAVFVDDLNQSWKQKRQGIFELFHNPNSTSILFNGTEREASSLQGSVVQIKMDCEEHEPAEVCIGFRINGILASDTSRKVLVTGGTARNELIALIILATLLLLTLFGSFFVWNVCWRMKKERLISEIQMQFLVHFKQQDEARKVAAASSASCHSSPISGTPLRETQSPSLSEFTPFQQMDERPSPQKRRLFFSTDFLDPHLMENPPPIAEQFLFDLRKMIDLAKDRIRMRKHVPQLNSILEEDDMIYQSYMRSSLDPVVEPTREWEEEKSEEIAQDSPRSGKSVDSGHDSLQSSPSSESKDSDESSSGDERNRETEKHRKQEAVRKIVNGFESRIARPTPISKIPTLSPRLPLRSLSVATGSASPRLGGRPPSGHIPRQSSVSSTETSPESTKVSQRAFPTSPPPAQPCANKKTKSKGYAVFPADPMLNKSLPRRSKREVPRFSTDNKIEL